MVLLISLSAVGEAMGTSSKYASNQDYIQSENLALKDKSNKMTDGKDSSVYRFKTRNGGEAVIDLGESCEKRCASLYIARAFRRRNFCFGQIYAGAYQL